jgi:hypothetical protein
VSSKWRKVPTPLMPSIKAFQRDVEDGFLEVFLSIDDGDWHMSICHKTMANRPGRYPTWDEIKDARYLFCPADKTMCMMLPPKDEYVNIHETTFHLWELHAGEVKIANGTQSG